MSLHCIYRISDNGYPKKKFEFATKTQCLENFIDYFGDMENDAPLYNLHVLLDDTNLTPHTDAIVFDMVDESSLHKYTGGSSAASWRHAWEYAFNLGLGDDDFVYFIEDDYLHRFNSERILLEGLERADYVSLYDHNDKYIPASKGGNKFVGDDGGETTKVILTESTHWKLTNSTTMTFAARMSTLRDDEEIWKRHTQGSHPNDFGCFIELRHKGKSLITPIPGYSTHCEPAWASPLIDWEQV